MNLEIPEVVKLVAVTIALLAVVTIFVSVRFFVRSVLLRSIDWDDGLVFTSFALMVAFFGIVIGMTEYGFGTNSDTVSAEDLSMFLKLQTVTQLCYVWGFVTVKMSFAALYIRLLPGQLSRRISQALLCVLTAEGVSSTFVVMFQCNPVRKAWTPDIDGSCHDLKIFYYVAFGVKFVTDVCLFVQPIPVVWKLQLSVAKRIGAILMLSIGLFVCIIAIIRVTYIGRLSPDVTEDLVDPMIWSQVEVAALLISACIPSLRPFLRCFPGVSKALGLSSTDKYSKSPYDAGRSPGGPSLPLTSRSNARQSRIRAHKSSHTAMATATSPSSDHGSQEEIFPKRHDEQQQQQGGNQQYGNILVTRDVEIGVESADAETVDASSIDKGKAVTTSPPSNIHPKQAMAEDMSWVKL